MKNITKILKNKFSFDVKTAKYIGSGYDSKAYLINDTYIFKIAKHNAAIACYQREKTILEFLKKHYHYPIKIPLIEYYDPSGIIGYKNIKGHFLSKKLYLQMSNEQKEQLTLDIAAFLKYLHNLNSQEILTYKENIRDSFLADLHLLKTKIFAKLSIKEREYIENFINSIISDNALFNVPFTLCHNDLSANHILLDENFKLCGIIDFGDATVTQDYRDFVYLLEDSEEEIGFSFGKDIMDKYEYKDTSKALQFASLIEKYYPIETLVCGIENDDNTLLNKGLKLLRESLQKLN